MFFLEQRIRDKSSVLLFYLCYSGKHFVPIYQIEYQIELLPIYFLTIKIIWKPKTFPQLGFNQWP